MAERVTPMRRVWPLFSSSAALMTTMSSSPAAEPIVMVCCRVAEVMMSYWRGMDCPGWCTLVSLERGRLRGWERVTARALDVLVLDAAVRCVGDTVKKRMLNSRRRTRRCASFFGAFEDQLGKRGVFRTGCSLCRRNDVPGWPLIFDEKETDRQTDRQTNAVRSWLERLDGGRGGRAGIGPDESGRWKMGALLRPIRRVASQGRGQMMFCLTRGR